MLINEWVEQVLLAPPLIHDVVNPFIDQPESDVYGFFVAVGVGSGISPVSV